MELKLPEHTRGYVQGQNNAGTVEDLTELFARYSAAGANNSIVAIPTSFRRIRGGLR